MLSAQYLDENQAIEAYLSWWTLAGLTDGVSDAPCHWLAPPSHMPQAGSDHAAQPTSISARPVASTAVADAPPPAAKTGFDLPGLDDLATLEDFDQWLHAHDLPGRNWSDHMIYPTGAANAELMILTDVPDEDDIAEKSLFSGEPGRLLDGMIGAIGFTRADARLGSMAFTRPIGGKIPQHESDALVAIARRHIALAKPRRLLLLGQQACLLLTGQPVSPDGKGQREINHCGSMTAAFAAHHPRLLIARPQLKRPAWEALKRLKEIV